MKISDDVVALSEELASMLEGDGLFETNPFLPKDKFLYEMQKMMQNKLLNTGDLFPSEDEVMGVCNEIIQSEISSVLGNMVESGIIKMSVEEGGEIAYSLR